MIANLVDIIHTPEIVVTALVAIATFATILTVALPIFEGDKLDQRMKTMAKERARLRAKQREAMERTDARGRLRQQSRGFTKEVVEHLNLTALFDMEDIRDKLRMAGMRGQRPMFAYLFLRIATPIVFLIAALVYIFALGKLADHSIAIKLCVCLGALCVGYYLPAIFLTNLIQRRQTSIKKAFPDSLDLLMICVEGRHVDRSGLQQGGERNRPAVD